jgi:coiled-coil domain-containing protein 25
LNKTKVEKVVDHEQEKTDRLKAEAAARRTAAAEKVRPISSPSLYALTATTRLHITYTDLVQMSQKKEDLELARAREAEKAARSYDSLFSGEPEYTSEGKTAKELEEDFM